MPDRSPKLILAVDGGGSKTLCWVGVVPLNFTLENPAFEIKGCGRSGPSNPRSVGFDQAISNIESAMGDALQQCGLALSSTTPPALESACISLAGVGRVEEQQRVYAWAEQHRWARQLIVVDDVVPLKLAAQYEHRNLSTSTADTDLNKWTRSITLVVGTGTIALGCNENGLSARSDGWGYVLGDQGSGYAIGLAGLRSICEALDQGLQLSAFHRALLTELGLEEPKQLIAWIYQDVVPRPAIAALARIVLGFADQDPDADALIKNAIDAMAKNIINVAKRLNFSGSDYALALSGGVLRNHPWLVERLRQELVKQHLSPQIAHVVVDPIYGAMMLAWLLPTLESKNMNSPSIISEKMANFFS